MHDLDRRTDTTVYRWHKQNPCAMLRRLLHTQAELLQDFEKEKRDTFSITADMTRQYKAMQEELLKRLNLLENTIQEQKDQLGEFGSAVLQGDFILLSR